MMVNNMFGRFFKNKKKKSKRGFTIVEAVIAMAVIAIVSAAATSTVRRTLLTTGSDFEYERARVYTENAFEAFIYSDNIIEFNNLLLLDNQLHPQSPLNNEDHSPAVSGTFSSENGAYSIYISVFYPVSGRPHFLAIVTAGSKQLINIDYYKDE